MAVRIVRDPKITNAALLVMLDFNMLCEVIGKNVENNFSIKIKTLPDNRIQIYSSNSDYSVFLKPDRSAWLEVIFEKYNDADFVETVLFHESDTADVAQYIFQWIVYGKFERR